MPTATHRHHKGRRRKGQSRPAWQSLTDGQEGTSAQAPRVRAGTLQNPAHCERQRRKQPERAQQQRKLRGPGSFAGDTGQLGAGVRGRNVSCAERDRGMHFSSWVGTVSVQPSATRLSDSPSWDTEAHPVIHTPLSLSQSPFVLKLERQRSSHWHPGPGLAPSAWPWCPIVREQRGHRHGTRPLHAPNRAGWKGPSPISLHSGPTRASSQHSLPGSPSPLRQPRSELPLELGPAGVLCGKPPPPLSGGPNPEHAPFPGRTPRADNWINVLSDLILTGSLSLGHSLIKAHLMVWFLM